MPKARWPRDAPVDAEGRRRLTARFAELLRRIGIDAPWAAEALAADEVSGFPELLEKMKSLPTAPRGRLREFLLGRWAMLDAEGGVAFFQSRKDEDGLSDLLCQWQRLDFSAAVAKAEELGETTLRRTLRDKALVDPAGLLAWLENRPDLNPLSVFRSDSEENLQALSRLTETDPDKMLEWARQRPEEWNHGFLKNLAAGLARRNPDRAAAWARSIHDPAQSAAALTGVAGVLATTAPQRAVDLLAKLPKTEELQGRLDLYAVIQKLGLSDAGKGTALAENLPPGEVRAMVIRVTMMNLMTTDPAAAFALSAKEGSGTEISWLGDGLPAAAKTPDGARRILEAAGEVPDSAYRESIAKEALAGWQEKDPASLATYLREKGDTPLLGGLRRDIQKALAVQQWRDGQADPELLALVGLPQSVIVESRAMENPAAAARGLESLEDPAARQRLAGEITKEYAAQDRGRAMAWAETVKDPEVQAKAWKTIAGNWVEEDSWQASQWIAGLPAGKGRDSAVLAMAQGISKTDPDLAWQWALSMGDPALRGEALSAAAQAWNASDAEAFEQALSTGTLTAEERQSIPGKLSAGSAKTRQP